MKDKLDRLLEKILDLWGQYGYPTDAIAEPLLYILILVFAGFVVSLWLRWYSQEGFSKWVPMKATVLFPTTCFFVWFLLPSFNGTPDGRCAEYKNGRLLFLLVGYGSVSHSAEKSFGSRRVALTVQAPERWGENVHLCVFSADDKRIKKLIAKFKRIESHRGGDASGGGNIAFTFGTGAEGSNVVWVPDRIPEEKGKPDIPFEGGDGV